MLDLGTVGFTPTFKEGVAVLSKRTLQPWPQSFPTPTRLCWKEGMILVLRTDSRANRRLPWAEDLCQVPDELLTRTFGADSGQNAPEKIWGIIVSISYNT